jgi:hypothetical protein
MINEPISEADFVSGAKPLQRLKFSSVRYGYMRPGAAMTKLRGDSVLRESTIMQQSLSQKEAGAYYTPDPVVRLSGEPL